MDLDPKIIGTWAARRLGDNIAAAIITIGSDRITRGQLAKVGCYNFLAARHLHHAIQELGLKSGQDLFDTVPPSTLAVPGLGVISLAVLGAVFEALKIGGTAPLATWIQHHHTKVQTFHTIKKHEARDAAQERRDTRARRQSRRNKAHAIRVARYTTRVDATPKG